MSVKFLHYRYLNNDNKIDANGGATVAYVEGEEGITYAMAFCNIKDNYNKAYGRAKASGRLLSERFAKTTKSTRQELIASLDSQFDLSEGMIRA